MVRSALAERCFYGFYTIPLQTSGSYTYDTYLGAKSSAF